MIQKILKVRHSNISNYNKKYFFIHKIIKEIINLYRFCSHFKRTFIQKVFFFILLFYIKSSFRYIKREISFLVVRSLVNCDFSIYLKSFVFWWLFFYWLFSTIYTNNIDMMRLGSMIRAAKFLQSYEVVKSNQLSY